MADPSWSVSSRPVGPGSSVPGRRPHRGDVAEGIAPWTALEYVVADAGKGLQNGIALLQQGRHAAGQTVPENALDVSSRPRKLNASSAKQWQRVERLWEAAEVAEARAHRAGQQGQDRRGPAARARRAWDRAIAAFRVYERGEAGWRQARRRWRCFGRMATSTIAPAAGANRHGVAAVVRAGLG